MDKQDRVVKTTVEPRNMFVTMPDGKKMPVKGKVIQTYWESGRIDAHVEIEQPLSLSGEAHNPQ